MNKTSDHRAIRAIAGDYFDYMGRQFPTLCLSDEFYFFPRAKSALRSLATLESLDKEKISQNVKEIKRLRRSLAALKPEALEDYTDLKLLEQSLATFLREFDDQLVWRTNPTLYLKMILLGVEHILVKAPYFAKDSLHAALLSKLRGIPGLIKEAKENLKIIPAGYLEASLEMVDYATEYFWHLSFERSTPRRHKDLRRATGRAILALNDLKSLLRRKRPAHYFLKEKSLLTRIIKDSLSLDLTPEDIFAIASGELAKTKKELRQAAKNLATAARWQSIAGEYRLHASSGRELLTLYEDQIAKILTFLKNGDLVTISPTPRILVRPTPYYMLPVRASASYACPISDDPKEPAFFYITPDSGIHNEYIFVSAHETFPGHHLLDAKRRSLNNPIRSQIESPLFYEGWASYAEQLVGGLPHIRSHPAQKIIGLRRQAWRAVRAMLDSGIRTKEMSIAQAQKELIGLGYPPRLVAIMLRHYLLTPGYQLCYTIGKYELERLKKTYAPTIGARTFHDLVLESGQIPFALLEKKLEAYRCQRAQSS
ncbi:DUF885 family protein [Candidatus Omnitrophota bacterium]